MSGCQFHTYIVGMLGCLPHHRRKLLPWHHGQCFVTGTRIVSILMTGAPMWPYLTSSGSSPAPLFSMTTTCKHQSLNIAQQEAARWSRVTNGQWHCYHHPPVFVTMLGVGDQPGVTLGPGGKNSSSCSSSPLSSQLTGAPTWTRAIKLRRAEPEMLRSWETTEEKIDCVTCASKNHGLGKIYLEEDVLLSPAICMRGWTRCALWLTVAVFLTKNLNLTLSKFWPPAPAEMRNSPLPTNGSFRQEIYVKKTLQHSPGEDVYSLCLQRIPNQRKHCLYFSEPDNVGSFLLWNEDTAQGLTLSLKSAQKLPTNAWIRSLTEQWR